ncbi:MAG: hypothetical protein E7062_03740 [Spirochaetaceae bacterium]|nr:hypothetical protein [Spirochaetaceae bacterium]
MKKKNLFQIILIFSMVFSSCIHFGETNRKITIINNTDKDIEVTNFTFTNGSTENGSIISIPSLPCTILANTQYIIEADDTTSDWLEYTVKYNNELFQGNTGELFITKNFTLKFYIDKTSNNLYCSKIDTYSEIKTELLKL